MGVPLILRYPLDITGKSRDNLVDGELHTLSPRKIRALVPYYGAFFGDSMVVRDLSTGRTLIRGEQYYPSELYSEETERTGSEIFACLIITDDRVSDKISITYQALGGPNSTSVTAIDRLIESVSKDTRPVDWASIEDKPERFKPALTLKDIGDLYGWELFTSSMNRVRQALELKDVAEYSVWLKYVEGELLSLNTLFDKLTGDTVAHYGDRNNPHQVTAEQIDVYRRAAVDSKLVAVTGGINTHASRRDNPHQVTAAQVGSYTISQTDTLAATTKSQVNAAVATHAGRSDNPHKVTAAQINAYTVTEANAAVALGAKPGNDHIADTNNPHQVTKAQVGLGQVQDYPVATTESAIAGTATNEYMTPALVKAKVDDSLSKNPFDGRYILASNVTPNIISVSGGKAFALIDGVNRQIWPAVWM